VHTPVGEVGLLKGTLRQQASVARAIDEVGLEETQALRRLRPIPVDAPIVAAIYAKATEGLTLAEESTRVLASNPTRATRLTKRAVELIAEANARSAGFGMTACAQ
jgi:hypothetical protein